MLLSLKSLKPIRYCVLVSKFSIFALTGAFFAMAHSSSNDANNNVRLFMVGDVMLGRGVDQILSYHVNPVLYEGYVKDARDYLKFAEKVNGPLPENRSIDYVWGDAKEVRK